jgi:hypothetical protein
MIYQPHALNAEETMTVVARTTSSAAVAAAMPPLLRDVDPEAVVLGVESFEDAMLGALDRERSTAELASLVAGVAVLLAAIGLYALSMLEVRRQRPELAIRIVLGARPGEIARFLWARAFVPVAAGLGAGAAIAALVYPPVRTAVPLIDAAPADAAAAALALLAAVAVALVPSMRLARRTNPNALLRVG